MSKPTAPCDVVTRNAVTRTDKDGNRQSLAPNVKYVEHSQEQLDYLLEHDAVRVYEPPAVAEAPQADVSHATDPSEDDAAKKAAEEEAAAKAAEEEAAKKAAEEEAAAKAAEEEAAKKAAEEEAAKKAAEEEAAKKKNPADVLG